MTNSKLLLFDFDGVLVDSLDVYVRAIKWCLERIDQPIVKNTADYLELFDDNFYEALVNRGVDLIAFAEALNEYTCLMGGDYYKDVKLVPSMPSVLDTLCRDHLLCIISSNSNDAIQQIFKIVNYDGYFQAILGSDFAFSKKDKIAHALDRFQKTPRETYYIGDTAGDIKEGREAGVNTVAVTWGWHPREKLLAANPDVLIDAPQELLNLKHL